MDERLYKISRMVSEYSLGNFDFHIPIENNDDLLSVVTNVINMLGEELKTITISKNYFNTIFDSVTDMVFVLGVNGWIRDCNRAVLDQLEYEKEDLLGKCFEEFQPTRLQLDFDTLSTKMKFGGPVREDSILLSAYKDELPVSLSIIPIPVQDEFPGEILITARDKRPELEEERKIQRAIINAQENEKQRLARDLHDSLGQQISATKFFINSAIDECRDDKLEATLRKVSDSLLKLMSDTRDACFSLMPRTLEEFGLRQAIRELCNQDLYANKILFNIHWSDEFPNLPKALEVDLYRAVQEFMRNAIQHGKATGIKMNFMLRHDLVRVVIVDNGIGFDKEMTDNSGTGLGNVRTRILSHSGTIEIESGPGNGTLFDISIPFK